MPIVRPFRALRYDSAIVGPLESVIAPPYDVIGREDQDRLYEASPYNVIRLDLARESDRYASASRTFSEWRKTGALRRDGEPAFYVYAQRYRVRGGAEHERFGFFARLRLEEFGSGKVLPHEKTLASAKADRLELQRACRANLSSIFGLYSEPGFALGAVPSGSPTVDLADASGIRHRLWQVTEARSIRDLEARLGDRVVYIADGHHRYETALGYRDEMRERTGRRGGDEPFDYVLAYLVNMEEPGLVVLPTHRMLRELGIDAGAFVERLRAFFRVEEVARAAGAARFTDALRPRGSDERRIGVALAGVERRLVLVTRDGENDARLRGSVALRRLDVTLLHGLVLEGDGAILGLDAHREAEAGRLVYTKDAEEALDRVDRGEMAAAFLLNPTRLTEVRAVSQAGETMPEKSTYFYPKIPSGLVFNPLED